jgi:hypothetical protein
MNLEPKEVSLIEMLVSIVNGFRLQGARTDIS